MPDDQVAGSARQPHPGVVALDALAPAGEGLLDGVAQEAARPAPDVDAGALRRVLEVVRNRRPRDTLRAG
jgi:hypothetical protein